MTVAELVDELRKVPQDLPVEMWGVAGPTPSDWDYIEIEEVHVSGNIVFLED